MSIRILSQYSLSFTEAEDCACQGPWLVGHYGRYQMPAVTERIMEGSCDKCQVWWSSPRPQLPAGISTQPGTEISSCCFHTVKSHMLRVCCVWDCRWRRWRRGLEELQALAAPVWAAALPLSGSLVAQFAAAVAQPWEAEPAPLCPPTAAVRGVVMCRAAAGRSSVPEQCVSWLLAPRAVPLESQPRQHCLALLSLEGRRSQNSP